MIQRAYRLNLPQNPLVKIAAILVTAFMVIGAIFLGAIVLFFLVGFAVLAWLVLRVRLWWLRRQLHPGETGRDEPHGDIVEAEYTVIEERSLSHTRHRESE